MLKQLCIPKINTTCQDVLCYLCNVEFNLLNFFKYLGTKFHEGYWCVDFFCYGVFDFGLSIVLAF